MTYWDLITYCKDTKALIAEISKIAPDKLIKDEKGNPTGFVITKTPTIRQNAETLSVVRVNDTELAIIKSLTTIKILSEVPAGGNLLTAMTKANRKIYDRVYSRKPQPVLDEKGMPMLDAAGKQITVTPPELIGMFA